MEALMADNGRSITQCFSGITEPRDSNKRHQLIDILTIALCTVISGGDTWGDMKEFGKAKYDWFRTFLELPHGIPSSDTFARVFAIIDPVQFREAFLRWIVAIQEVVQGVVAIDGKTLRHSFDKDTRPIHMVSALSRR